MLTKDGARQLQEYSRRSFQRSVTQVAPGVWFAAGLGHSNAIFVEGARGVILVDALDTLERGQKLRALITEKTGKRVHTLIYTHSHPDHRWGGGAFLEDAPEVIAFAPKTRPLEHSGLLGEVFQRRAARQFGYTLSDAEALSQGLGPREGACYGEHRVPAPPTTTYDQDKVCREIDGVELELVRLPGETDDQIGIWLPVQKVLCCGDNYYGCFPNLYAIRGGQYRDIAAWVRSLDALRAYPAQALLPGHTQAVLGTEEVQKTLKAYRDALHYILTETLKGMNEGKGPDELAARLRLPGELARAPFLGEHYGCVEWTVREIFSAYMGWFDGDPVHLHPLAPEDRARRTLALMGGGGRVLSEARKALGDGELQWCLELICLLEKAGETPAEERNALKAKALLALAEQETSANGRHYYITCAKELEKAAPKDAREETV